MSSPAIDLPLAIDRKASRKGSTYWRRRREIIQSAIKVTLTAAYVLQMGNNKKQKSANDKSKNAKWDEEVEVFQLMEYLKGNASKATGGLFTDTVYNQAAEHIIPWKPVGTDNKTGAQVDTKYNRVCSLVHLSFITLLTLS